MKNWGDDERVEIKIGTATPRRFVYDEDGRLIGEYGATVATINAEHVWLMPEVAEGGYEPLALVGPTTTSWVHGDHLGTPVMITSSAGVRVNDMQATPFGNRYRTAANSPKTAIAFPGQIIDIADRHYNMHRDYDPTLGRYLQADPIGLAGGDNVYGYVGGNPVGWSDPIGLEKVDLFPWNKGNQVFHDAIASYNDVSGTCQVYAHGAPQGIQNPNNGKIYTAAELASLLAKHCDKKKPVVLYSCRTGLGDNSGAEGLGKLWDGPVYGATQFVWFNKKNNAAGPDWLYGKVLNPDGTPFLRNGTPIPNKSNPGYWRKF